jgi:hypothetical protein
MNDNQLRGILAAIEKNGELVVEIHSDACDIDSLSEDYVFMYGRKHLATAQEGDIIIMPPPELIHPAMAPYIQAEMRVTGRTWLYVKTGETGRLRIFVDFIR